MAECYLSPSLAAGVGVAYSAMNRVKVWIFVPTVAVLASVATLWACIHVMRDAFRREAQTSANEIADDIELSLERLAPVAQEREYAIELSGYMNRHPRIQRLQLVLDDGASGSLPKHAVEPIVYERKAAKGDVYFTQRAVKLSESGHATLAMRWTFAGF